MLRKVRTPRPSAPATVPSERLHVPQHLSEHLWAAGALTCPRRRVGRQLDVPSRQGPISRGCMVAGSERALKDSTSSTQGLKARIVGVAARLGSRWTAHGLRVACVGGGACGVGVRLKPGIKLSSVAIRSDLVVLFAIDFNEHEFLCVFS